jgi:hypothetical protein
MQISGSDILPIFVLLIPITYVIVLATQEAVELMNDTRMIDRVVTWTCLGFIFLGYVCILRILAKAMFTCCLHNIKSLTVVRKYTQFNKESAPPV